MSERTERNCNKCIRHTSGDCDSWDCKMQTVEDVKKEAVNEYAKSVVEELEERKALHERLVDYETKNGTVTEKYQHIKAIDVLNDAIEIVKQEADKYNNGWIPCSERLPEDDSICIVTVEYPNNKTMVDYGWFDRKSVRWFVGMQEFRTSNVLAWQPLPEPYKERY